jgi:hypothetical protein
MDFSVLATGWLTKWFEIAAEEEYSEIADEFVRACAVSQPGRGGMSGRKPTFLLLQI